MIVKYSMKLSKIDQEKNNSVKFQVSINFNTEKYKPFKADLYESIYSSMEQYQNSFVSGQLREVR